MYGRIGKLIAVAGKRDELASALLAGIEHMPGCLSDAQRLTHGSHRPAR